MSNTNNIIFKNKGEVFKCSFDIDGATSGDVKIRLCLEFNDNKNMFFHGKMDRQGNCTINIPKLTELDDKQGNLRIEAIVDDTYFNLYECPIELKSSVQMKIKESSSTFFNNSTSSSNVRVQFGKLEKEQPIEQENPFNPKAEPEPEPELELESELEPELEEIESSETEANTQAKTEESKNGWKKITPEVWKYPKKESTEPASPPVASAPTSSRDRIKSFQDFVSKKSLS